MTSNKRTRSFRILVVDDNAAIHEDFRKILVKAKHRSGDLQSMEAFLFGAANRSTISADDFEMDCAFQGKDALELVRRAVAEGRPYSLALIDGRMPPGWDGVETIGRLWEEDPDVQIVLCTAYADYSWDEIQRALGKSDSLLILKKPFDNVEILQLAHALTCKWQQQRESQLRLNKLAFYDDLTGLPNRTLFLDRLALFLELAQRFKKNGALLFIDLDNFKRINDTLGHSVGDELLKISAERLGKCLRTSDTVAGVSSNEFVARLGGDEFTVVLPEMERAEDAAAVARRISEILGQPIDIGDNQVIITPSIGIAIFPQDGDTMETLIKNADTAMYFAKRIGPNLFKYYQESMTATALKRLTIENHLRRAIRSDEFTLHYQPQFELSTGRVSGLEALLRWESPELGDVPPLEFIPVAEECGLIITIGEWVLRTACRQAATWVKKGIPLQRIAVNFSVNELTHPNFLKMIRRVLSETTLEPQLLEIEITESVFIGNEGIMAILNALKDMRLRIAIDDFGTGYSNLFRLKEMPIDCLKIDRSFLNTCGVDGGMKDGAIICAIIDMAQAMGLRVIAEGVETTEQADFLKEKHCQEVQGYLFSRPMSTQQVESYFRRLALSKNHNGQCTTR